MAETWRCDWCGPKIRETLRGNPESVAYKSTRRNAPDKYNHAAFGRIPRSL